MKLDPDQQNSQANQDNFLVQCKVTTVPNLCSTVVQINNANLYYSLRYLHSTMAILKVYFPKLEYSNEDIFKNAIKEQEIFAEKERVKTELNSKNITKFKSHVEIKLVKCIVTLNIDNQMDF
jgi:hypothetical protein